MLIPHDPDAQVVETSRHVCPYHKLFPHRPYAGCTCSASYGTRKATPEEYRKARLQRLQGERDRLRAELSSIEREIAVLERDESEGESDHG